MIPIGFLAAAGARAGSDFVLLETATVGAGGSASVVFSNLNANYGSTYKHLQIRFTTRSTRGTDNSFTRMVINTDSAANYSEHAIRGNGSTIQPIGNANVNYVHFGDSPAANASAGVFNAGVCDILDAFNTSKFKTTRTFSGIHGGGLTFVQLWSSNWRSTNAITTLTISDFFSANLAEGSRFSLYGVK